MTTFSVIFKQWRAKSGQNSTTKKDSLCNIFVASIIKHLILVCRIWCGYIFLGLNYYRKCGFNTNEHNNNNILSLIEDLVGRWVVNTPLKYGIVRDYLTF